jgi:transposase
MSLRPDPIGPVPERDCTGCSGRIPTWHRVYAATRCARPDLRGRHVRPLFSERGRPAEAPWRLALVSVMQFAERLSDRKAANAVRGRIDWKYALGLPLDDPGFDASVLCEFRARLLVPSS